MHLDPIEYKTINNVLAWVRYGTHGVTGADFEQQLGATEEQVEELLRRIGAVRNSGGRLILALNQQELTVVNRAFRQMLDGPAELSGASRGTPDWELLGVTEREFGAVHAEVRAVSSSAL